MAKTFSEEYYGKFLKGGKLGNMSAANSNRDVLNFSLEGLNQPIIDVTDIQQVVDRASLYFKRCAEDGLKPGVAQMCVWIGINRNRWQKWLSGAEFKNTHMAACNKINSVFDAQMESYMQDGKINPVSAIFLMKNNHGYTDTTETKVEQKNTVIEEKSIQEILKLAEGKKRKPDKN